ncbi:MAG: hypothetical protein C0468_06485, partial [Planctomyces sp.]|nr:hypothetical protein [Planctomyces sp.]
TPADHPGDAPAPRQLLDPTLDPLPAALTSPTSSPAPLHITLDPAQPICPRFMARVIRGVRVGPSPDWLRHCLEAVGQRSINNVVDATNFVLLELGNPCHIFDLAALSAPAGPARVHVRAARPSERLALLDGKTISLHPSDVVICDTPSDAADASRPASLAGVMGGARTAVSDSTTDLLLEMATWDPARVRATARRHGLRTDASHRYERLVTPESLPAALDRLAALVLQLAGGRPDGPVIDLTPAPLSAPTPILLRPARVAHVLGVTVPAERIAHTLSALRCRVIPDHDGFVLVFPPPHRPDLRSEIDLIEEVARTIGYDATPTPERIAARLVPAQPSESALRELARVMTGLGFFETVTFSFTSRAHAQLAAPVGLEPITIPDQRRGDQGTLRTSVLCGLLACRKANQDARASLPGGLRLFETAARYAQATPTPHPGPATPPPARAAAPAAAHEQRTLAFVLDLPEPNAGLGDSAFERRQAAVRLCRGVADSIAATLLGDASALAPAPASAPLAPLWDPAATAELSLDGRVIGHIGLASPAALASFDLATPVAIGELLLDPLLSRFPPRRRVGALPSFPAIERDLSLVVPEATRWAAVHAAVHADPPPGLELLAHLSTYRGSPLAAGTKSLAFRLRFRAPDRTLRDDEVTPRVETLVRRLQASLGASLRE